MLKIIVKILSTWTTLKIIVSKIWLDMRTFRVATHKKARDNIYVTGFVVNVIKRISIELTYSKSAPLERSTF